MSEKTFEFSTRDLTVLDRQELFFGIMKELQLEFNFELKTQTANGRTGRSINEMTIIGTKSQFDTYLKFQVELLQFSKLISCEIDVKVKENKNNYTLYNCKFNFDLNVNRAYAFQFIKTHLLIADGLLYA